MLGNEPRRMTRVRRRLQVCSHSAEGTQLFQHRHHVEVVAYDLDFVIRNFDHLTSPNLDPWMLRCVPTSS